MRGIVVENKNGCSAVLRDDGVFENVEGVYEVGASIELTTSGDLRAAGRQKAQKRRLMQRVAAAAVALMILAGSGWNYMTVQACTTVKLDGGASIEYTLNRLDRVIGVTATAEEDEQIVALLEEKDIESMTLPEAMDLTREVLEEQSRWTEESPCEVSVESKDAKRTERLQEDANRVLGGTSGNGNPDQQPQTLDNGQPAQDAKDSPQAEKMNEGAGSAGGAGAGGNGQTAPDAVGVSGQGAAPGQNDGGVGK